MACARYRETSCLSVPACPPRGQQPCHPTRPRPGTAIIVNEHGYLALDESPSVRNERSWVSTARPILDRFKRARGGFGRRSLSIPRRSLSIPPALAVDAAGTPVDAAGTPVDAAGLRWMRPGSGGCGRTPVDAADARGGFGRDAKATREPPRAVIRAVSAKTSRARAQTARGNPDGTRAESHAPRAPIRRREPTAGRGQWSSGRAPTPLTTGFGRSGLAGAAPHSRGTSTRATVLRTGGPSSRRVCHERRHVTT
jgi:hypothetical protein